MSLEASWRNSAVEEVLISDASLDAPWELVERFSVLVRESGSKDELQAFDYISGRLKEFGIPHEIYRPRLFISLPRKARLQVIEPHQRDIHAKAASMSHSTQGRFRKGRLTYLPAAQRQSLREFLGSHSASSSRDVGGRIALTEGFASPGMTYELMRRGAVAAIFINPGEHIHESICTTTWGTPDLDSVDRKPSIPVVSVNAADGEMLRALSTNKEVTVRLSTVLEEGWIECPLCVAEISGVDLPEEFVLVHGHVDSWHVGVGDNATGNATLLEVARVLWKHRERLARTVRVAWWPGHSQGRYAGSTWYADTFALDIDANCVAHLNCDSPGCRWASVYEDVFWMSETEEIAREVIRDITGMEAAGGRPLRAGDKSFSNIGVSTFLMLSSTMPQKLAEAKNYYPVGGCGGNIAWHTEDDTLEVADRDNLLRDIGVYLISAYRCANAPLHPLDFRSLAAELAETLHRYQNLLKGLLDLDGPLDEVGRLQKELDVWYAERNSLGERPVNDPEVRAANRTLRRLSRILVPINFTRYERFRHDPALDVPPLPDLAPAESLNTLEPESHEFHVTLTHLLRGRNRVTYALKEARETLARH